MRLALWPRTEMTMRLVSALADGARWRAVDLADHVGTSAAVTAQIVAPLVRHGWVRHGWVRSVPGPAGGHELVADVAAVSVLDLIETVEGPTIDGRCVMADRACPSPGGCPLHDAWVRARDMLTSELRTIPLAQLLDITEDSRSRLALVSSSPPLRCTPGSSPRAPTTPRTLRARSAFPAAVAPPAVTSRISPATALSSGPRSSPSPPAEIVAEAGTYAGIPRCRRARPPVVPAAQLAADTVCAPRRGRRLLGDVDVAPCRHDPLASR